MLKIYCRKERNGHLSHFSGRGLDTGRDGQQIGAGRIKNLPAVFYNGEKQDREPRRFDGCRRTTNILLYYHNTEVSRSDLIRCPLGATIRKVRARNIDIIIQTRHVSMMNSIPKM